MENSLRPPEPLLNIRARGNSCPAIDTTGCKNLESFRRKRAMSNGAALGDAIPRPRTSWFSLELLYTITDIVLVICAAVFIISGVASIGLWIYGFEGKEKNKFAVKH
jgi:hypothetical protein